MKLNRRIPGKYFRAEGIFLFCFIKYVIVFITQTYSAYRLICDTVHRTTLYYKTEVDIKDV
jgi:hypothetical protein